ncbi:glycosyltransferase family 2 protein [Amphiplicatus metriothermophilus]|uniref:Glycosyltransferase, catalytic subunit of cellulose synthase and poly-beta-1,6-N-acetylglucosamine synthase n=1 Tax=Amphiplicatus metriothermophilus TaxID=1519374 RepID=A0A239PKF1_9PROT|nr:glycosyltransferase family 2 protein [Amphiplicatus metriothermophilus]MBB5517389.1 cellulose synthase/poly-beta-1,6-N-acetylglucosamine synthase-like glycosyltransferase [Amphiplicatus metriothermophilus]SNT68276.1 Glycosyltransferase, catalytic subunit of cellulose synthase and poly-beta-1,6-N-acetylglucosamine synthase [Amphiplicatus metriothermophilus]
MARKRPDLDTPHADETWRRIARIGAYARAERLPLRRGAHGVGEELRAREAFSPTARERAFPLRACRYVPRRRFQRALAARFEPELAEAARSRLVATAPTWSAARLLSTPQKAALALFILAAAGFFAVAPLAALIALNAAITAYFLLAIGFRIVLTAVALKEPQAAPAPALAEDALPTITILAPLFREAACLPGLDAALDRLDYPKDRLDVKLLLEAEDRETIAAARQLGLDRKYHLVVVPPSRPQTKPKACNHGLYLARGEIVGIYDAEDEPEPDQLRKVAAAFAAGGDDLACVQAQLNYYNADENWLTRLFALEYSLWFDLFLPALERLRVPMPLGGTSNFFRTQILVDLGGWDPYNVTEDADLGLRLARRGWRATVIDSTTFEEANCRIANWLRQRSRWMKGHLQTWCVHMRGPAPARSAAGWRMFAATQLFLGGTVFSALINPFLWAVFVFWLATRSDAVDALFPGPLMALNLFALLAGNAFFVWLATIAPLKRGTVELAPAALFAPVYWWLSSFAAYRAVRQLLARPHFWEKTEHMISPAARRRRAVASTGGTGA